MFFDKLFLFFRPGSPILTVGQPQVGGSSLDFPDREPDVCREFSRSSLDGAVVLLA